MLHVYYRTVYLYFSFLFQVNLKFWGSNASKTYVELVGVDKGNASTLAWRQNFSAMARSVSNFWLIYLAYVILSFFCALITCLTSLHNDIIQISLYCLSLAIICSSYINVFSSIYRSHSF